MQRICRTRTENLTDVRCGILSAGSISAREGGNHSKRRFYGFILGLVLGGTAVYLCFQFHIVQTSDRILLVRKVQPSLNDLFADIRHWKVQTWRKHLPLARHLVSAGYEKALFDAAAENDDESQQVQAFLQTLQRSRKTTSRTTPRPSRELYTSE